MASFVADAFALLEAGGVQDGVLDDESMMLSFQLGERSFSVVGADYPGSTLVFAEGGDKSFKGLSLELIVAELSLNRAVSDTQPQDDEPEPMVAVPAAVPLWLQHVKAAKLAGLKHVSGLRASDSGEVSFKCAKRSYTIQVDASSYPRDSCVMSDGVETTCLSLIDFLAQLDSQTTAKLSAKKDFSDSSNSGSDLSGFSDSDMVSSSGDHLMTSYDNLVESDDLAHFAVVPLCGFLVRDMMAMNKRFGPDTCHVMHQVEDQLSLRLSLFPSFLSGRVAVAWGITVGLPIYIALKDLSASSYCSSPVCGVKIWQESEEGGIEQIGVIPQLQFLATEFLRSQWTLFAANGDHYLQDLKSSRDGSNNDNNAEPFVDPSALSAILGMGFGQAQAREALVATENDLEAALAHLTGDKSRGGFFKKKKLSPGRRTAAPAESFSMNQAVENAAKKKASFRANHSSGLLVALLEYLTFRLGSLNEFCPLCDQGHMFGAPMLKPAICRRELCAFAFSKLGLMSDCVDGVAMQAEVIDLLVSMFRAAAFSQRASQVCDPFPLIYDPQNPETPVLSDVAKHLELSKTAVQSIKMSTMMEVTRAKNTDTHPLAFPLMQWIVSSNRSHLVKLSPEKNLNCMDTKYQFLMLSAPPEHEEHFAKLKAKNGSRWAFHGSRTENWHSILRAGLRNASGTKLQINGAAYGSGVYLSPTAQMSLGYSQMHGSVAGQAPSGGDESFLDGTNFHCLAIVELICGCEKDHKNNIWTVVDDKQVVTRFFIVYPPGSTTLKAAKVVSTSSSFISEVENAMKGFE